MGGALDDGVCVAPAFSVSQRMVTVVICKPGEQPQTERRENLEIGPAGVKVSKQGRE